MTKQEIEKAIENDECVWVVDEPNNIEKVKPISIEKSANRDFLYLKYKYYTSKYYDTDEFYYGDFECFFKSKAEAEHYLHHANVSRTEHLPFLTWEEFLKERYFGFYSIYNEWIDVYVTNGLELNKLIITIENATKEEFINNYDLTEENFYKAYDECVRLFREEE